MTTDTRELRARIIYDPEPDLSWLEQDVYAESNDPDDHVTLAVLAEAKCSCCDRWEGLTSSLWGIDFLTNDSSIIGVPYEGDPRDVLGISPTSDDEGTYTADELRAWLRDHAEGTGRHYLATVALEVLDEARLELAPATNDGTSEHEKMRDELRAEPRGVYRLARLAGVPAPDAPDSPGGEFLANVALAVAEAVDYEPELLEGGAHDALHEVADGAVPVYTAGMWRTFVDLAAWEVDVTELGPIDDLEKGAQIALYMIAERLAVEVLEELAEERDEDEEDEEEDDDE